MQIEPEAKAVANIKGFANAYALRAGAKGQGTLVDVSLPLKFSFRIDRSPGTRWGLTLSSRLTALKLEASLFYQTRRCRFTWLWPYISCKWSDASDIYKFGEWSALSVNKEIFAKYF